MATSETDYYTNPSSMKIVVTESDTDHKMSSPGGSTSGRRTSSEMDLQESFSNRLVLDPMPKGRIILAKAASHPHRMANSTRRVTSTAPDTPPLRTDVQQPNNQPNALINARANLGTVEVPRRYPLLPPKVKAKYDQYTYLDGVKPIPSNTLEWKVPLLQKKNQLVIEDHLKTLFVEQQKKDAERKLREQERIERERLESTPEWKRPLVRQKEEKKKVEQLKALEEQYREKEEQKKFLMMPPWQQELTLRKKEAQRLEHLPDWQRELIQKKKVLNNKKNFERA